MADLCLYFQAHQPHRLRRLTPFDIGKSKDPLDHGLNSFLLHRVADRCYLPTNKLLLDLIHRWKGGFRICFSLSGCLMEQLEAIRPDVIRSFQELAATGCVEFLGETYEHSLAFVYDREEFTYQLMAHAAMVHRLFGQEVKVFRNTELIYTNALADVVRQLGFRGLFTEGTGEGLGRRTAHKLYVGGQCRLPLLLRDFERSDDLAFRFNDTDWTYHPLEVKRYSQWLTRSPKDLINICMDYETFGEHQGEETALQSFVSSWVQDSMGSHRFLTPSLVLDQHQASEPLDIPAYLSWADEARDISAWLGNDMQVACLEKLMRLKKDASQNPVHLKLWRKLTQSDHFYYMATKSGADQEVHDYFSPYRSPHDAYLVYMNVLSDFELKLQRSR